MIATRKTAVSYRRGSGSARGVENSSAKGVHAEAALGAASCFRMFSGRGRSISRAPECEAGLERNARDDRAAARIDGARRRRSDGAEAAAVQAFVRTGSELSGSGREVAEVDRVGQAERSRV